MQLLVLGADPAPFSTSPPVGQEAQGGGKLCQGLWRQPNRRAGGSHPHPVPPPSRQSHTMRGSPHLLITRGPGGSDGAFFWGEGVHRKPSTSPVQLQVAQGMPPSLIASSYVLGQAARAVLAILHTGSFRTPSSSSALSYTAKNSSPLHPCSATSPCPPKPLGSSGEAKAGLSAGAGSCLHPLPFPKHSLKMGTKSCFPHQEFACLNQTIFSQTAPRLERETWQLPAGREEGTPLVMPAALGPEESGVSVLQPFAQQRLKPR